MRETTTVRPSHLKIHVMPMDGNCMFHALAYPSETHAAVRSAVVDHMSEHWRDDFHPFLETKEAKGYLRAMSLNGTWGDQLALRAFSECFQMEVRVYRWKRDGVLRVHHRMIPSSTPVRGVKHLVYDGSSHYDCGHPLPREEES